MVPAGLEFVAQHVLSGRVLGVVDFTQVSFHAKFNQPGEWSGTVRLHPDSPVSVLDLTEPWQVRIFAVLNDLPVYALDVWYRQRRAGSLEVRLSGKLAGSWLDRVVIGGRDGRNLRYDTVEQQVIARDLVLNAQDEWGSGGIDTPVTGVGTRFRDKNTWDAADGKPYGEALRDLAGLIDGFQFMFEPYVTGDERQYGVRFVTGYPFVSNRAPVIAELSDRGDGQMTGNVRELEVEESVGAFATDVIVLGSGEGDGRLRGYAQNAPLGASIPRLARVENRSDVITREWLNGRAETLLSVSGTPMMPPALRLASDDPVYPLGSYQVGDRVELWVDECPQFPNGLQGVWRIFEVQYNPLNYGSDVVLTIGDGFD